MEEGSGPAGGVERDFERVARDPADAEIAERAGRHAACVMRTSTYAEEIDLKRAALCDRCLAAVRDGA